MTPMIPISLGEESVDSGNDEYSESMNGNRKTSVFFLVLYLVDGPPEPLVNHAVGVGSSSFVRILPVIQNDSWKRYL